MKELSRVVLAFSVAFAVFLIGPALLPSSFPAYPLITVGDVFDILTPLVLLPLYWLSSAVSLRPATRLGPA